MSENVKFLSAVTDVAIDAVRRRFVRAGLAFAILVLAPAALGAPPPPPQATDAGAIARIEGYLNRINTMQSRFIQVRAI